MWFLVYVTLMNGLISQRGFQNVYRFNLGITQVGIIEISIILGLIYALIRGNTISARYPNARTHPALISIMVLLALGIAAGLIGAAFNAVDWGYVLRASREFVSFPLCIIIGYRLLPNSRSAWKMMYAFIIAGICTATMLLYHFKTGADKVQWGKSWNEVRSVNFITAYAGMASLILFYSLVNPATRLLPRILALPIAGYCLIGQFAPMHRADWVATTLAFLATIPLLPGASRTRSILKAFLLAPIVAAVLYGGVHLGSYLTQSDYAARVHERIISILPTERKGKEAKAWDTRLGGVYAELAIWIKNPLFGEGFGYQSSAVDEGTIDTGAAYNHNGWVSVLAITGIFGFAGWMGMIGCMIVIGYRMAKHPIDRGSQMVGLMAYASGVWLSFEVLATMIITTRAAMFLGLLCGMMFRCRDMEGTTLALQQHQQLADETWLYEHGHYNAEGGWIIPGQAAAHHEFR